MIQESQNGSNCIDRQIQLWALATFSLKKLHLSDAAGFAVSLHSSPDSMALRDCISKVGARRRKRTEAKTCQEKDGTSVHGVENLRNKFFECFNVFYPSVLVA